MGKMDLSNDLVVLVIGAVLIGSMFIAPNSDWIGDLLKIGMGGLIGHLSKRET